jgi:hypothetical protein
MQFEELFRDYWWLLFPFFGMGMAVVGVMQEGRRSRAAMDLIRSYVDQGKEPPAELLKLALQQDGESDGAPAKGNSRAWTFVTFAALTAGFATGWYLLDETDIRFAFATVTVTMAVLAVGALLILLFGRK